MNFVPCLVQSSLHLLQPAVVVLGVQWLHLCLVDRCGLDSLLLLVRIG